MNLPITYALYIIASMAITVWVARILHRRGRSFLVRCFHGNQHLADSVNALLVVGFYLVNFAYVTLALKYGTKPNDLNQSIEFLATKVGLVLMLLSTMHYVNLFIFSWIAKQNHKRKLNDGNPFRHGGKVVPH